VFAPIASKSTKAGIMVTLSIRSSFTRYAKRRTIRFSGRATALTEPDAYSCARSAATASSAERLRAAVYVK
jgi:hypothetical protein